MTDLITYAEAAKLLKLPYTALRAYRKRIGAPESVVVTSGTQPALFSKRAYEEFALDHNVKALIAAERYFDRHGVYPNQGDAKPSFNKLASTFLKGAYLTQEAQAKREAMIATAKQNKPQTVRVTIESDWAWKEAPVPKVKTIAPPKNPRKLPKGVHLRPHGAYIARIKHKNVDYKLGTFSTLKAATDARLDAERQIKETGRVK